MRSTPDAPPLFVSTPRANGPANREKTGKIARLLGALAAKTTFIPIGSEESLGRWTKRITGP
jgi:hypothetical protein